MSSNQQRGSPIICDASWLRAMGFSCRRFSRYLRSSRHVGWYVYVARPRVVLTRDFGKARPTLISHPSTCLSCFPIRVSSSFHLHQIHPVGNTFDISNATTPDPKSSTQNEHFGYTACGNDRAAANMCRATSCLYFISLCRPSMA